MAFLTLLTIFLSLFATPYAEYSFPTGLCYDKKCGSSPYEMRWVSSIDVGDATEHCISLTTRPCIESQYKCCSQLEADFKKFVMHVRPECKPALRSVTVNGIVKKGGLYYETYTDRDAELKITALSGINTTTANKTRICMTFAAPCRSLDDLCVFKDGLCYTAAWETIKHECCPRCTILNADSPPFVATVRSPPPPAASPPPPVVPSAPVISPTPLPIPDAPVAGRPPPLTPPPPTLIPPVSPPLDSTETFKCRCTCKVK